MESSITFSVCSCTVFRVVTGIPLWLVLLYRQAQAFCSPRYFLECARWMDMYSIQHKARTAVLEHSSGDLYPIVQLHQSSRKRQSIKRGTTPFTCIQKGARPPYLRNKKQYDSNTYISDGHYSNVPRVGACFIRTVNNDFTNKKWSAKKNKRRMTQKYRTINSMIRPRSFDNCCNNIQNSIRSLLLQTPPFQHTSVGSSLPTTEVGRPYSMPGVHNLLWYPPPLQDPLYCYCVASWGTKTQRKSEIKQCSVRYRQTSEPRSIHIITVQKRCVSKKRGWG